MSDLIQTVDMSRNNLEQFVSKTNDLKDTYSNTELYKLKENTKDLRKAANAFEAIFVNTLLKEMRKTIHEEDGIMPPSSTQTMFQEMLDETTANNLAEKKIFGIADAMYKAYEKHVDANNKKNSMTKNLNIKA